MRQVEHAELVWTLMMRMRSFTPATRNGFASRNPEVRRKWENIMAALLSEGLARYEILTDAPIPEGADLYSRAAYGLGGGTAPPIAE